MQTNSQQHYQIDKLIQIKFQEGKHLHAKKFLDRHNNKCSLSIITKSPHQLRLKTLISSQES